MCPAPLWGSPVASPSSDPARRRSRLGAVLLALLLFTLASACSSLPRDPGGTLDRVTGSHVLRAGASPSEDLVTIDGDKVGGTETQLVEEFADQLGATVEWTPGGEEELVTAMERGELDVIVGGLTDASPWVDRVSLTRPYLESEDHGQKVKHVMAAPLGENAMLVRLERFLDGVGQ